MKVEIVSRKVGRVYSKYKKIFPSRRAAFRAAKRDRNIPMSQHPDDVVYPNTSIGDEYDLDDRNVRLYVFNMGLITIAIHIREDKEAFYVDGDEKSNQSPHFNSGRKDSKLKDHHYWKND